MSEITIQNAHLACEHGHQRRQCPHCEIEDLEGQLTFSEKREQIALDALREIVEPRLVGDFVNYEKLLIEGQRMQDLAENALAEIEDLKK